MLYYLQNISTGKTFYLINQNEFIIGRKNCDILIENDTSISRAHAKICIKDGHKVTIEDLKSTYKTFINKKELTPNVEVDLKENDKVQFGVFSSIFKFHQIHFVTTATQLSDNCKEALKKQLDTIQGRYLDNWTSECTHLTLQKISLTVKVLHALLEDKPIVVPAFWAKFVENVSKSIAPPKITDYNNPPLAEALLNRVEFKKAAPRKNLFMGKHFLFYLEKEEKQVKDLIRKAGGTCSSWENNPIKMKDLTEKHLVMQSYKDVDDKNYKEIMKHVLKQNKRTIPIQEIAMAIIHGSCEKDCNPSFNRVIEVFNAPNQIETTQNNLLVHNTQTQDFGIETSTAQKSIQETVDSVQMTAPPIMKQVKIEDEIDLTEDDAAAEEKVTQKRVCDSIDAGNPTKKVKKDETDITRSVEDERKSQTRKDKQKEIFSMKRQSQKRKTIEDSDSEEIPIKRKAKNPFLTEQLDEKPLKNQTENNNPFIKNLEEDIGKPLFSSTQFIDNISKGEQIKYTSVSGNSNDNSNSTWHSKRYCDNVKTEEPEEISSELLQFIKMFEKKVRVEVLSEASFRSRIPSDEVDCNDFSKCTNFKKFKKVKPVYPQTKVIGQDSFRLLSCTNTTGINDTRRQIAYDSDDERPPSLNRKQKHKLKIFEI
ncbi:nibrin [Diorhabda carinulata]|uniref:nibrin n=1 Tax=Diorhabda carinulata TaxID=1163345 RepID=UPI0025A11552|nr:nibrin [Diorhabda carinulata]